MPNSSDRIVESDALEYGFLGNLVYMPSMIPIHKVFACLTRRCYRVLISTVPLNLSTIGLFQGAGDHCTPHT